MRGDRINESMDARLERLDLTKEWFGRHLSASTQGRARRVEGSRRCQKRLLGGFELCGEIFQGVKIVSPSKIAPRQGTL